MPTSDLDADQRLMRSFAARDAGAADVLYRRFAGRIYGLGLVMLGNDAAAQDLVQDTFVKLWRSAERYDRSRGKLETWVLLMARSLAIDAIRRRVLEVRTLEHVDWPTEANQAPGPDDRAATLDLTDRAKHAMLSLPLEQRAALELAYLGGKTSVEISDLEGIPGGTAKTRIRAALMRLRELLAADIESTRGGTVTTCDDVRPLLPEVALGTAADPDDLVVRRHLRGCGACRRELEALQDGLGVFGSTLERPAPPELRDRVSAVLAEEWAEEPPKRGRTLSTRAWRVAVAASLALAFVAAAFGAIQLGRARDAREDATSYRTVLATLGGTGFKVGTLEASDRETGRRERRGLRVQPRPVLRRGLRPDPRALGARISPRITERRDDLGSGADRIRRRR